MKKKPRIILYGFLVWLIPFIAAFLIYPIHESNRPFFESIMPVIIVTSVVLFCNMYFRHIKKEQLREGFFLGLVWLAISILLDLLMFMWGPMKISFLDYMADIGLTYLIIPVICIGFGYVLSRKALK
ncbi:hypothetical protein KY366_07420 [Candidatus Woesearchaeota archaeon]|nr:hypothetical protein [Candidatus Woesearchaeota archaeon]